MAITGDSRDAPKADGPSFARPPITELAIAVQFRPLADLRGINLGSLRDRWRQSYPSLEEHPPLVPAIEGSIATQMNFQLSLGQGFTTRYWFLSQSGEELVQIQNDRFVVNWRKMKPDDVYPRYKHLREVFARRLDEFGAFLRETDIGFVDITQAEVNYINRIQLEDEDASLETFLRLWRGAAGHHLGSPNQASIALSFTIPNLGRPPSRLHVSVGPGDGPSNARAYFLTLIARGAPKDGSTDQALAFVDSAHDHATQSFVELTTGAIHGRWGIDQ